MNFDQTVEDVRDRFTIGGESDAIPENHTKLLDLLRRLKNEGNEASDDRLASFERADRIYRAFRVPDEDDKKASDRNEPIKIIYPVTYAQIQTTLAALMAIYNRTPLFELEGRHPQFQRGSKLMELELQYQLDQGMFTLYLYQTLLDMLRYGFGKINTGYERKMVYIREHKEISLLGFHMALDADKPVIGYEGANFTVDDPYVVAFDPSVSIGDIQKAQYVFRQEQVAYNELMLLQEQGVYFNVQGIPRMPGTLGSDLTSTLMRPQNTTRGQLYATSPIKGGDMVTVDTCYVKLVPYDYSLSELKSVQIWEIVMGNENRIIKAQPSRFNHGMFPTSIIEYSPDLHSTMNDGMAQTIDGLQEHINWLLNSHIANVRKVINDVLIVDPSGIEVSDLENRRSIVRLKAGKGGLGVERFIKQLAVSDVTQAHVGDANTIFQMLQRATGISDNVMGVQLPTTRTATEVQSLQRLSAGRIHLLSQLIYHQGLRNLGQQMIQNTQQFMSAERFLKVNAGMLLELGIDPAMMQGSMLGIGPEAIQGQFALSMVDLNTPSDKMGIAQKLQELLVGVMQAPQLIPLLGVDISQMITQIMMNYGIKNTSDFINPPPPDQKAALLMQLLQQAQPQQAQVMDDEKVADQVQRGNLIPNEGGLNGRIPNLTKPPGV